MRGFAVLVDAGKPHRCACGITSDLGTDVKRRTREWEVEVLSRSGMLGREAVGADPKGSKLAASFFVCGTGVCGDRSPAISVHYRCAANDSFLPNVALLRTAHPCASVLPFEIR